MDQDQLDVYRGQAKPNLVAYRACSAWGVLTHLHALERFHESRNLWRCGGRKHALREIDAAILPGPGIDLLEPHAMQVANVIRGEPLIGAGLFDCSSRSRHELRRLRPLHLTSGSNAQKVAKNPAR